MEFLVTTRYMKGSTDDNEVEGNRVEDEYAKLSPFPPPAIITVAKRIVLLHGCHTVNP